MYAFGTHERNPSGNASGYDNQALSFAAVHIGTRKVPLRSRQDPGGTQAQDERSAPHLRGDSSRQACHPPTRSRSGSERGGPAVSVSSNLASAGPGTCSSSAALQMRDDHLEETRNAGIGGRCRYAASDTLGRESGSCGDARRRRQLVRKRRSAERRSSVLPHRLAMRHSSLGRGRRSAPRSVRAAQQVLTGRLHLVKASVLYTARNAGARRGGACRVHAKPQAPGICLVVGVEQAAAPAVHMHDAPPGYPSETVASRSEAVISRGRRSTPLRFLPSSRDPSGVASLLLRRGSCATDERQIMLQNAPRRP